MNADEREKLAEVIRQALIQTALDAYEEGGLAGLCDEGRWELAVDRLRSVDLLPIVKREEVKEDTAKLSS